jgi:hypothetical protein
MERLCPRSSSYQQMPLTRKNVKMHQPSSAERKHKSGQLYDLSQIPLPVPEGVKFLSFTAPKRSEQLLISAARLEINQTGSWPSK